MDGSKSTIPSHGTGNVVLAKPYGVMHAGITNGNDSLLYSDGLSKSNPADCLQDELIFKLYRIIVPITFTFLIVLGIIGNILVIFVILSRKKLQTVTNFLLLNLAVSDVSFLLICGGFSVVHYVLTEWPLGDALCRITQYLLYVTCYVTIYTLTAVSAVRYVTVIYGSSSSFIRSKKNVVVMIIIIWIVFMIAKIPILLVHGVSQNKDTNRVECIIMGTANGQKLFASFFTFAYAIPLLFICTLYLLILRHLRAKKSTQLNSTTQYSNGRKRHVTKVVIIVVLTFAICWLPLHLHLLVAYYGQLPETVYYKLLLILWQALSFLNSMLNPIIYNYVARDFRDAFRDILCFSRRGNVDRSSTTNNNNITTWNGAGNEEAQDEANEDEHEDEAPVAV